MAPNQWVYIPPTWRQNANRTQKTTLPLDDSRNVAKIQSVGGNCPDDP